MAPKKKLGNADIARYAELDAQIKKLTDEFNGLKMRFKEEIPDGSFDSPDGKFEVKRWAQTGALKTAEFIEAYNPAEPANTLLYTDELNVDAVRELINPADNPDLFTKVPNAGAIKEVLPKEEVESFFQQIPYVKVVPNKTA